MYAGQAGATQGAGEFAAFPDYATGYQALLNQIQLYASRGYTVQQMMNIYLGSGDPNVMAPTSQGDSVAYANTVAAAIGASPNTTLTDISTTDVSTDSTDPTSFMASLDPTSSGFSPLALGLTAAGAIFSLILLNR